MSGDVYSAYMPFAFPWVIEAPKEQVRLWVRALMSEKNNYGDGSSFAIDVAVRPGMKRIWLSDASLTLLRRYFPSVDNAYVCPSMGTPAEGSGPLERTTTRPDRLGDGDGEDPVRS